MGSSPSARTTEYRLRTPGRPNFGPSRRVARFLDTTVNLILLECDEVDAHGRVRLVDGRATHLRSVLGVVPGQAVRIGVVDGPFGVGTVSGIDGEVVELACAFEPEPPPRPRIDLLLAVPRPKVLRRLWAQLSAMGVGRVILTNAEKVERPYFDTHYLSETVYRPLLVEGLQQARDTRLPQISIHRRFKVLVEDDLSGISDAGVRVVADPSAPRPVHAVVADRCAGSPDARVLLAVGPEGGWNAFELELLQSYGFECAGLGPRTLRTDTACLSLLAVAHDALA